jgi:hypothetical protein
MISCIAGLIWLTSLRSSMMQLFIWGTVYAYYTSYRKYLKDPKVKTNGLICSVISTVGTVVCYNIPVTGYIEKHSIVLNFFSGLFCGYITWDLILNVWKYSELQSPSGIIHHVLFLSVIHYGQPRGYFPGAIWWLLAGEISTIFLHWRNILASKNLKDTLEYTISSYMFVVTFIACRPVLMGYQLGKMILDRDQWQYAPFSRLIVGGLCGAYLLNIYWTYFIVEKVVDKIFGLKISF